MVVAVVAALACAGCFATASVLQQRAAREAPKQWSLRPRLFVDLARRPMWLLGLAASAAGFCLQGLALHFGGLVLVQPLILMDVVFALPFASRIRRIPMGRREWASTIGIAGGIALFLAAAAPHGGTPTPAMTTWGIAGGTVVLLVAAFLLLSRSQNNPVRTTLIGAGAGLLFGLLAALLAAATYLLAQGGIPAALSSWQPYCLAVVALTGELLAQSAYQSGPLAASLPAIDSLEPAAAIAIGIGAFGEQITHSPLALTLEIVGLLAVLAGIVQLDRSPLVHALVPAPRDSRESTAQTTTPSATQRAKPLT